MKKFIKELLTGVVALGMLAPVATTAANPIQTTVNAKRHHRRHRKRAVRRRSAWHHYAPRDIRGHWLQHHSRHQVWGLTFLNKRVAFNPSGAAIQNWNHPYYRYDDHHTYTIRPSVNSYGTEDYLGRHDPERYYIKVRSHKRISVWINGTIRNHIQYIGTYHHVSKRALFD